MTTILRVTGAAKGGLFFGATPGRLLFVFPDEDVVRHGAPGAVNADEKQQRRGRGAKQPGAHMPAGGARRSGQRSLGGDGQQDAAQPAFELGRVDGLSAHDVSCAIVVLRSEFLASGLRGVRAGSVPSGPRVGGLL
jgi:hypothetical protein